MLVLYSLMPTAILRLPTFVLEGVSTLDFFYCLAWDGVKNGDPERHKSCVCAMPARNDVHSLTSVYSSVRSVIYYPQPILAQKPDGLVRLALCFISEEFSDGKPPPVYINEMIQCAREMKAPENYISHIESFGKLSKKNSRSWFTIAPWYESEQLSLI